MGLGWIPSMESGLCRAPIYGVGVVLSSSPWVWSGAGAQLWGWDSAEPPIYGAGMGLSPLCMGLGQSRAPTQEQRGQACRTHPGPTSDPHPPPSPTPQPP